MAGSHSVWIAWDALAKDEEFSEFFDGSAADAAWNKNTLQTSGGLGLVTSAGELDWVDGVANGRIGVTLSTNVDGAALVFRRKSSLEYWRLEARAGLNYALRRLTTTTDSYVAFFGPVPANGDQISVLLHEGTITPRINGVDYGPYTDFTFQTARGSGVFFATTAQRVNDFFNWHLWTDVSAYVRAFKTERGQKQELGRYEAGVLTGLVLNNADRRFEPGYTSSPYYPYVIPGRPCRVQLDGTTIWRGFLDEFPLEWEKPFETDIEVNGSGAFEQCANLPLRSVWRYACEGVDKQGKTRGWYRFTGLPETRTAESAVGTTTDTVATLVGDVAQGGEALAYGEKTGSLKFGSSDTGYVQMPAATAPYGSAWEFEMLFQLPKQSDDSTFARQVYLVASDPLLIYTWSSSQTFIVGTDETLRISVNDPTVSPPGGQLYSVTSPTFQDARPHHLVVKWQAGSNASIWIDGVLMTPTITGAAFSNYFTAPKPWLLGAYYDLTGLRPHDGNLDEIRTYTGAPLAVTADAAAQAAAAFTPWKGDATDTRLVKVLAAADFPRTRFIIDSGMAATLDSETDMDGLMLLDYLRALERSEGGPVYEQKDGKIRVCDRRARWMDTVSTVVQRTLGDKSGESEYEKIEIIYSRARVRNVFEGQRLAGNPQRIVLQSSADQLGERSWENETDLRNDSDDEVRARGYAVVEKWGFPGQDVRELVLRPVGSADPLWAVLQTMEIGDMWEVRRTRPDGTRFIKKVYVEYVEYTHEAEGPETSARVFLSPQEPAWGLADGNSVVGTAVVSW